MRFELVDPGRVPTLVTRVRTGSVTPAWRSRSSSWPPASCAGAFDPRVLDADDLALMGIPLVGRLPPLPPPAAGVGTRPTEPDSLRHRAMIPDRVYSFGVKMRGLNRGGESWPMLAAIPRATRVAWTGAIGFGIGLVVTAPWVMSTTRLYRSEAVIVWERGVQAGTLGHEGESVRAVAARLQDAFTSRQRLESLIRDMKLYRGLLDKRGLVAAIEEMRKHISVSNREGYTYRINYDSDSRDLAKDVLERLTASVVDEDAKRRNHEAEETKRFLDAERKQADEDLQAKEEALASFLTKHPQLAAETGTAATAGGLIRAADRDRAGTAGGEVTGLELQAAQLEQQLAAEGSSPRVMVGNREVSADPQLVAALTRTQTELQAAQHDLAEKQLHLTNEHPDVKQAQRRVALAEAAERRAAAALAAWKPSASRESRAPAAGVEDAGESGRSAALRRALGGDTSSRSRRSRRRSAPRGEMPRAPSSTVAIDTEWTHLNREVSEARERQNQLEGKQFQAQLAATLIAGGQGGQLVIADPPFKPMRPIAGGRFKIAMVGVAGSVVFGLIVILVVAMFDDRLYAANDVEGVLPDGIVVVIPKVAPRLRPRTGGRRHAAAGKES